MLKVLDYLKAKRKGQKLFSYYSKKLSIYVVDCGPYV